MAAAKADFDRAAKLCPDEGLANWRRHQTVVGRLIARPLAVLDLP